MFRQYYGHKFKPNQEGAHPTILVRPFKEIKLSVRTKSATPDASLWMFPRSPTCRAVSFGAPCVFPYGLKWLPADRHPPLRSPDTLSRQSALQQPDKDRQFCALDMESARGVGVETFDVSGDLHGLSRCGLLEGHGARHRRVTAQNDYSLERCDECCITWIDICTAPWRSRECWPPGRISNTRCTATTRWPLLRIAVGICCSRSSGVRSCP